jgi:ABC-2 type transport system permease protein
VFDIKGLGQLAFGIGTIAYSWSKIGLAFTPLMLLKLIVFLITASLIMIALQNAAAATCFWIQNSFYVLDLAFRFKDYAKYPVTIFSSVFRFIFTFIIPIAFIAYYPSLVILRPDEIPLLSWLSPFIGIAFFFVSYKIWMHGAMKYNGTGS